MKKIFITLLIQILFVLGINADNGEKHLKKYQNAIPQDQTIENAKKLNIKIPVMCREWHVWWGAPFGSYPHMPRWQHWNSQRIYGKADPNTTIEQIVPGTSWRRWLNTVGYPLIGPYDPIQPDIIRWQLQTAKNAGIECLHIHLWPSIWDKGQDFTPMPIFDMAMETAAKLKYPVAVHDEIMFRRPNISKAQLLANSIRRTKFLLKRYGKHPGWYKINNMPVYYFQNWTKWISAKDMQTYFAEVEKETGPVYWIIDMADIEDYYKIPQLKAVVSHNNSWFLYTKPGYGRKPHNWSELLKNMERAVKLAHKHGKKYGCLVYTRFSNKNDRGKPNGAYIPAENGMFFIRSLKKSLKHKPDFIVLTQWNDFVESAFIEPAWDCEDFNGDPYRYCRIVAASVGKKFIPAKLPARDQIDPYIRYKLFGDSRKGDMGPVFHDPILKNRNLHVNWPEGPRPIEIRFIQNSLIRWTPSMIKFKSRSLRLGNYSSVGEHGQLQKGNELRFYAPGLISKNPKNLWLGIRMYCATLKDININYRSFQENFRIDSRWERAHAQILTGFTFDLRDKTKYYWFPLYETQFAGREGDILIKAKGDIYIKEIVLWSPDLEGNKCEISGSMEIPKEINVQSPFVAVAYDKIGNAGQPRLIIPPQMLQDKKINKQSKQLAPKDSLFFDSFEDLSRWEKVDRGAPKLLEFKPETQNLPCLFLNDSLIAAKLPKNDIKSFKIEVKMLHTNYKRAQWVALLNKEGTKGYGFMWDSSEGSWFKGEGLVSIIKFDNKNKVKFMYFPEKISKHVFSGHKACEFPLAQFEFSYNSKTGELQLKVDNKLKCKIIDKSFHDFDKVYVRGHNNGIFDDLSIIKHY